jgi:hypothetical protein
MIVQAIADWLKKTCAAGSRFHRLPAAHVFFMISMFFGGEPEQ